MQCINIDVVIIGLQSENTLVPCVKSVRESYGDFMCNVIYVDGGSSDKTLEIAYSLDNLKVVEYPKSTPSPGGQRNVGWRCGTAEFVMFLDSDTVLNPYFLDEAIQILQAKQNKHIGAVFGQRNEKYPEASFLNFVGDIEWNPPFQSHSLDYGKVHKNQDLTQYQNRLNNGNPKRITQSRFTNFFGGDVLVRRKALEVTGGYDESLIAGEDPELGLRFTIYGFSIWYECIKMTKHDLQYAQNYHQNNTKQDTKVHFTGKLCKKNIDIVILYKAIKRLYRTGYGYASVVWKYSFSIKHLNHNVQSKIYEAKKFWSYELCRIVIRGCGSLVIFCLLIAFLINISSTERPENVFIYSISLLLGNTYSIVVYYILCVCLLGSLFFCLLLYPRIFSVKKLMNTRQLSQKNARIYALYCSLIVVPQSFGVLGFIFNEFKSFILSKVLIKVKNIDNIYSKLGNNLLFLKKIFVKFVNIKNISLLCIVFLLLFILFSCSPRVTPHIDNNDNKNVEKISKDNNTIFRTKKKKKEIFSSEETIYTVSESLPSEYLLGAGDVLSLEVWNRPKLSDPHIVVAPDGKITVMRIGIVHVAGRSIDDVITEIESRLKHFYNSPEVRLSITSYKNNKAFVLGRVTSPGLIEFSGQGTLLEALSRSGGLPILSEKSFLTKCAIIRGKKQILWIDLRDLLQNGNMALNARIYNNDIIFIPESENEVVYVMGEVLVPGAIQLKSEMTYLDALMFSGGPTKSADLCSTYVIRFDNGKRSICRIDLKQMLEEGDGTQNFVLQDNDVVYVSETGMASFNYAMQKILPALEVLNLGTSVLERFGIMENLRGRWYGTEGFVDGD